MTIAAILDGKGHEVIGLEPGATLQAAASLLASKRIGCVPVVEGGSVIGVISERDIVRVFGESGIEALASTVAEVMTSPAVTIVPNTDVLQALALMTKRRIRHLPVLDGGKMIGLVSIGDLVKHRIDRIEAEAEAMREYIQGA